MNSGAPPAPAPPSPATIDKSSVPIYELGVEVVSAVCKSVLGCVSPSTSRGGGGLRTMSSPSAMTGLSDSGELRVTHGASALGRAMSHQDAIRVRQSSQSQSQQPERSLSQLANGLDMYQSGSKHTDALAAHRFAASGFDASGESMSHSASMSASQLASMLSQGSGSAEAISSGDSSDGSSEPGTPASSISDEDEFYPKPMSLAASESAPHQLRSAVNFSLADQRHLWEEPKDVRRGDGRSSGWATASPPAMALASEFSRKSDYYPKRPGGLGQMLGPVSYDSTRTITRDAYNDDDGAQTTVDSPSGTSKLIADGPLNLMSPSWPWTSVGDDFGSLPICHGRVNPQKVFATSEDAYVFRSQLEASGSSSPTMDGEIKTAFSRFAHQVLSQTLLSPTAFLLGLLYILRIPSLVLDSDGAVRDEARALFAEPPSAAPFKLFTLGMMIANKQLDDNTFTNRTWQEVTGIPLPDLNRLELFYLERCHFEINVPLEVWFAFLGRFRDREAQRQSQTAKNGASMLSSPRSPSSNLVSGFDAVVSSECSRRVTAILKTLLNGEESISPLLGVGEPVASKSGNASFLAIF